MQSLLSALNNPNTLTIFVFIASVLIYRLRNYFLLQISQNQIWANIILYPGVAIHELSHMFFCLVTGAKIKDFKLFDSGGGYVEYQTTTKNVVRDFFISLAPLIIGLAILVFVFKLLLLRGDLELIQKIFIYYISLSVFLAMYPSKRDVLNSWPVFVLAIVLIIFFREEVFSHEQFNNVLIVLYSVTLAALIFANITILVTRNSRKIRIR